VQSRTYGLKAQVGVVGGHLTTEPFITSTHQK